MSSGVTQMPGQIVAAAPHGTYVLHGGIENDGHLLTPTTRASPATVSILHTPNIQSELFVVQRLFSITVYTFFAQVKKSHWLSSSLSNILVLS